MKDIEQAVAAILEKQKKQPDGLVSLILDSTCKATHVKGLDAFVNLKTLSLCSLGLTSLEGFPKLPKLERLILTDNRITGGLQHLVDAGLTSLRTLELANNRISRVEELECLKGLPSLQSLDVDQQATKVEFDPKKVFTMLKELKYLNGADEEGRERDGDEEEEDFEEEAGEEEYEEGGGEGEEEFEDEEGAEEFEEKEYAVLVGPDAVGEDEEGDYQDEGEGDDDDEEGEDEEDEGAEGAEPASGGTKRKREEEEGDEEGGDE
ncbi:hypothetical protein HYH02_014511 [Chlamydomonas schloesseri]|uniref:U2A'/phosphoprotein 32 family A C-terminal domain-containing protein n=1 Tax=Chlamydomonas schloesseri TaxID=2026947 RepID=A0A835STC9_9CHLO|nr:hypothetical protein HYH02_014511 [Chlamydomonas schloesseri]|eukprot:KAG2427909.1 hypothetical protein HYH02_014511 [Chlamydomonas schloesseri]